MMGIYIKETLKYILRSGIMIRWFVKHIKKLYAMTEKDLYEYSEKRFIKIFKKAIGKSEFYKKLYSENNIDLNAIKSVKDIGKLPIVDKEMITENAKSLLTMPRVFSFQAHTSGTTGTPLTVYHDYFSILREQAYQYIFRRNRGFKYGDRLVSLRGHLGHNLLKMKVHISNTLYFSSYQINKNTIDTYFDEIKTFNPVAIEGYPSSLYNMCFLLKESNRKLSIPKCFTSSETLFDFQRKLIEEYLNTEIYDYYGNTERSISLAECGDHRGYFSQPGYSINEFMDDHIITTSLINSSFPLIRYKVNDIVSLTDTPSLKESELCIVDSIDGRFDDTIIAKDGSLITRLGFLFKNLSHIKFAQIIQNKKGQIELNIVPDGEFAETERKKLINNINQRIGLDNIDLNISIVSAAKIIYTKRNKFRLVVSTIS
jgi:phenylacetate-CoA ligase